MMAEAVIQQTQRTDSWPTTGHRCPARADAVVYVRFRGACRDGVTAACADCGLPFVYVKPQVRRGTGGTAGPLHF